MGHKNREKEKKFVVPGVTLDESVAILKKIIPDCKRTIVDASRDYYWTPPREFNADFIRLRYMPDGTGELTIKQADRGGNTNRVEIDVEVKDPDQCKKFWEHAVGPVTGSVYKDYHVFFLDDDEHTTLSLYRVRGDKRIFFEAEAKTIAQVDQLAKQVGTAMTLEPESRSLYQIFIEKRE